MCRYHPHHHGSTAIQVGGGAAGFIIIEDADNEVPPEIASMEEVVLFFMHLAMADVVELQENFNTDLWQVTGATADAMLTNGQTAPTLNVVPGRWYRWRMAYVAISTTSTMEFFETTGSASCEVQLLAKDGVYLPTAPRELTSGIPFYSGHRADAAIRCTGLGTASWGVEPGRRRKLTENEKQRPGASRRHLLQPGGGGGGGGGGGDGTTSWTGVALTLVVSGTDEGAADLTPFTMNRPCYLSSTIGAAVSASESLTITRLSYVSSSTYESTFTAGTVNEIAVSGTTAHPFHLHVNHFQLATVSGYSDATYFQVIISLVLFKLALPFSIRMYGFHRSKY